MTQGRDLTTQLKNLAQGRNNVLMINYFEDKNSYKDPNSATLTRVDKDGNRTITDAQYCQIACQHTLTEDGILKYGAERAYDLLDFAIKGEMIEGHTGIILLPLQGKCLDNMIPVTGDGSESRLGATQKMPDGWKSTNFNRKSLVLFFMYPSISFINTLEDQSQKGIKEGLNKVFKEQGLFKAMDDGELRNDTIILEDESTETV